MIKRIDNQNINTANKIRSLFQISYAVEAELLKAVDFPPLKRHLKSFLSSETEFYGFLKEKEIVAIVETKTDRNSTDIQSLVVNPEYFRQGMATRLITFVLNSFNSEVFTVETGAENKPATQLYEKLEFQKVKLWNTESGIRKIKFERRKTKHTRGRGCH